MNYEDQAQSFAKRIEAAIDQHPEILNMTDPFKLFRVKGLDCSDVDTFAQASAALSLAQARYKARKK